MKEVTANPYADDAEFLGFDDVQEQLVEAFGLWRRSPGGGTWPFAKDAPWHLMQRSTHAGDYDARGGDLDAAPAPKRPPLSLSDIEQRDRVTAWLELIAIDLDRRLVCLVIAALASGRKRIPWRRLARQINASIGTEGLRYRYSRSLTLICNTLNARTC